MPNSAGKCTNFGNCQKADSGEVIPVQPGTNPICPVCQRPLVIVPGGRKGAPWGLIAVLLIACLLVGWLLFSRTHGGSVKKGGSGETSSNGTGRSSSGGTAVVHSGDALMYYERSDEKWLQAAANDFNKQHESQPQIILDFRGSREGKQDILYGRGKPAIWNPADLYWIDKLNMDWRSVGKHDQDVVPASKTILSTRFVLVMWTDRAKVFTSAMGRPEYHGKTWQLLYDLATEGWKKVGAPDSWGKLKLAQSDPTKSNGGQTTLALMFAEYRRAHPEAQPSSPDFVKFMHGIENAVPRFESTTSKGIDSMVRQGKDAYDGSVAYEANAITAVDKGQSDIRIIYPDPSVEIDFPAAILDASWVGSDEKQLAGQFIDYLLTRDVQKTALQYGLRPGIDTMRAEVDNAYSAGARGDAGFQLDPRMVVRPVGARVIDDLLYQWYKIYGS